MYEGNLDKSLRQFNSHDPLLLAAVFSPRRSSSPEFIEDNLAQGPDKITAIIDYMCVSGVRGIKSTAAGFQHGGFLAAL